MAEENKNEEKKASGRRSQRPGSDRANERDETKMVHPLEVEGPTTDSSQWATSDSLDDVDDARVIKEGDPIEVKTDDNGISTETVVREVSLMGTDRKAYVLVAREGVAYSAN